MAHRKRNPKWSLLLIRDADHRVKQFRVSGRTAVLLPAAAALTVAGCFAAFELQALNRINDLELRLAADSIQHRKIADDKSGEIASLKKDLKFLTGETAHFKSRMDELNGLELKLRQFIGKYGEGLSGVTGVGVSGVGVSSVSDMHMHDPPDVSNAALKSTIFDFSELSTMLDEMAVSMESSLRKAELKRAEVDSLPTEWPTVSRRLTSGFGYRRDPLTGKATFHAGVDISGDVGDPVYAAGDGKVKETGFNNTRGHYIIITHRNGLESWYMHLSAIGVKAGQQLSRGEPIGKMGNSGRSTGPHLHFQIVVSEEPVNPVPYLKLVKED